MAPWKEWETRHKHWLSCLCDSFGSVLEGLCGFGSGVFLLHGVTALPRQKVCAQLGFTAPFYLFALVEVSTYFSCLCGFDFVGNRGGLDFMACW